MGNSDRFGLVGCDGTIKVAAGHYVDLTNPTADMIDIPSIASALSKICRYGGHVPSFYSVAEHCAWAAQLAHGDGVCLAAKRCILLHDAAEAYLGDMVRPLKIMMPEYKTLEARMEKVIGERFDCDFEKYAEVITQYDRLLLKSEKYFMFPDDTTEWAGFSEIPHRTIEFRCAVPKKAETMFLQAAHQLNIR